MNLIEFPTESGGSVLVEIEPRGSSEVHAGVGDIVTKSTQTLESLLASVGQMVAAADKAFCDAAPDTTTVEVGAKANAESGIVFAKAAAEAQFKISMTWNRQAR